MIKENNNTLALMKRLIASGGLKNDPKLNTLLQAILPKPRLPSPEKETSKIEEGNKKTAKTAKRAVGRTLKGTKSRDKIIAENSRRASVKKSRLKAERGTLTGSFLVFEFVLTSLFEGVGKAELFKKKLDIGKAITQFQVLHNNLITSHGIKYGTARWKQINLYCVHLLEGRKVTESEHPAWLATGRIDGWPRAVNEVRQLFHQVRDNGPYRQVGDQIIRSLFAMQRVIEDFDELSLDSIEYKGDVDPVFLEEFTVFLDELLGDCTVESSYINGLWAQKMITAVGTTMYEYVVKPPLSIKANGPNKVPKCESATYEAYLMRDSKELYPHLLKICEITDNKSFSDFLVKCANMFTEERNAEGELLGSKPVTPKPKTDSDKESHWATSPNVNIGDTGCLRKITAVTDKGNKSRVVAMLDYWTQALLQPFESNLNRMIKLLYPTSSNIFDHEGGFIKLTRAMRSGLSCLDATSWTDTFNVKIQKRVVRKLYGREYSEAWANLVVHCLWNVKGSANKVRYLTGQGMGTHGSFQIASLTYLLVMEFLTKKNYPDIYKELSKTRNFESLFNQIGDDSWNQDPDGTVRKDLVELVGMPINFSKSKYATDENLVGEYVSRNINYGHDVSRISLNLCRQVGENIFYLPDLVKHLNERCVKFDIKRLVSFLMKRVKQDGVTLHYKDHIWASFYKSLIVDNIIHDDKVSLPLLIAVEANLSGTPNEANDLTVLRTHFTSECRLDTLKFMLMLQDCEYMYSKVMQSFGLSKDLYGKHPFGVFSKQFDGVYFNSEYVIENKGLKELSALHAAFKTKAILSDSLFKLGLDTSNSSRNISNLIVTLTNLQGELVDMCRNCVYTKSYLQRGEGMKHRIDRSYHIQKLYVSGELLPDNVTVKILNLIPNIALLGELSENTFDQIVSQYETSYPVHDGDLLQGWFKSSNGTLKKPD
jgi:hypothetical protein